MSLREQAHRCAKYDFRWSTALFGRLDMIPVLVAHGANANHVDARGGTALQMAIAQRNMAAADALRQAGAKE